MSLKCFPEINIITVLFMVLWFSVLTFTHNLCNLKTGQQLLWHFNTVFSDGMFVPVA